eukprot:6183636-Pleurochrysis_carterae.AAC.2
MYQALHLTAPRVALPERTLRPTALERRATAPTKRRGCSTPTTANQLLEGGQAHWELPRCASACALPRCAAGKPIPCRCWRGPHGAPPCSQKW